MKVTITKDLFRKHPKFHLGLIKIEEINPTKQFQEARLLLKETEQLTRLLFAKDTLKNHHLISPWAVAQREFGKQAKHYHTSVERLVKKVIKKRSVVGKDTITTLVNYLTIKHLIPMTVDDYSLLKGNLTFNVAKGGEKVGRFGKVMKNALYYRDRDSVLGTKLDYWKSNETKVARDTTSILVHIEALPPITSTKVKEITKEVSNLLTSFCGGKAKTFVLNKKKSSVTF